MVDRPLLLALLLTAVGLSGGCAAGPAVREAGTGRLYDPSLVGTWTSGRSRWTLARAGDFGYALTLADPLAGPPSGPPGGAASAPLAVDLVQVGPHLYLLPAGQDDLRGAVSGVLVRLDRPAPDRLEVAMPDLARLAELVDAPPADSADRAVAASASTTNPASRPMPGLRRTLKEHGDAAGLFVPLGELRRAR